MYAVRKDTLAGIKQSALFESRKINPPLPATVAKLNEYMQDANDDASPEGEALKFYYANHVFSLICARYDANEPLPEPVRELARGYVKLSGDIAVRLAYYVLMIITREARHFSDQEHVFKDIEKTCGKKVANFCRDLRGHNENAAVGQLRHHAVDVPLESYLRAISKIFNDGSWSGSFGGVKWGNISETLRRMTTGEITAEMFCDIAFTLAHNGGPIFNKGMLYATWGPYLQKILDVQRSGQIPQLVVSDKHAMDYCDTALNEFIIKARAVYPADLGGHVDWYKVEALGSLHKYTQEKNEQAQKYGVPKHLVAEVKALKAKEQVEAAMSAASEKMKYYVGNGANDFALKYDRKVA